MNEEINLCWAILGPIHTKNWKECKGFLIGMKKKNPGENPWKKIHAIKLLEETIEIRVVALRGKENFR